VEKFHEATGAVNASYKTQTGPPVSHRCSECESPLHVSSHIMRGLRSLTWLTQLAGPMWSGPLHDVSFVEKVLEHLEADEHQYGTLARMKGMLTVAKEAS
jgi:tRNA (guanine26-N2/guanine27-N2)-dimethyltransferase